MLSGVGMGIDLNHCYCFILHVTSTELQLLQHNIYSIQIINNCKKKVRMNVSKKILNILFVYCMYNKSSILQDTLCCSSANNPRSIESIHKNHKDCALCLVKNSNEDLFLGGLERHSTDYTKEGKTTILRFCCHTKKNVQRFLHTWKMAPMSPMLQHI